MKGFESPRYPGRNANEQDMKILLGGIHDEGIAQRKKWPDAGLSVTVVQGKKVWVKPILRIPGGKSSKHRVMCECPDCGAVLSAGRLPQHVCKEQGK